MATNIFEDTNNLDVDFSSLEQDIVARGRSRFLFQFMTSGLLNELLDCISEECDELYQAELQTQIQRTLSKAQGVNLDVLGDLVGAEKILYDYAVLTWMTPDAVNLQVDQVPVWTTNAPLTGNLEPNDEVWKQMILAKIFKNHMSFASLPEIRFFIKAMTGLKISLIKTGVEEVCLAAPANTDRAALRFLTASVKNVTLDFAYVLPVPPDVKLNREVVLILNQDENGVFRSFAPDQEPGKADYGMATIIANIGGIV